MQKVLFLRILLIGTMSLVLNQNHAQEIVEPEKNQSTELSLDGDWEIIFDPNNQGQAENWHLDEIYSTQAIREIKVPSCWEEYKQDYEGVAFYRKKFVVPKDWEGKIVELNFDAANYKTEVWLNGVGVGFHEGGFTPFRFRVDEMMKAGEENTLIVRIIGPIIYTNQRIDGIGRQEIPMYRGAMAGGIWQSVWLGASDQVKISDVFIEPNIADHTASFSLQLSNYQLENQKAEIRLKILSRVRETVAELSNEVELQPGKNALHRSLKIKNAQYWSPDDPYLYHAEIEVVQEGKVSDSWSHKFGLREFTMKDGLYHLNGKPLYLKAIFFEGLYPVKLANLDSREMAIKEILLAKEAGFNMIRPWRKPPPPQWLDLCDSLGVLTVGSLVVECMGRPVPTPYLSSRFETELSETVMRDRNRTCVVLWELFNEIHKGGVMYQMRNSMSLLARELDPTRLILDESGGWDAANMYLPYHRVPFKINDIHHYPGNMITRYRYDQILMIGKTDAYKEQQGYGDMPIAGRSHQAGLPSTLSELGYASWPNFVQNNAAFKAKGNPIVPPTVYHQRLESELKAAFEHTGFDEAFPDFEAYCLAEQKMHGIANKRMIEAARVNPDINGYCIHALTDGDWILGAGILDLWRNPKTLAYDMTREANQAQIISIRVLPRNVYAQEGTFITVDGANEWEQTQTTMAITIQSGEKEVFQKEIATNFAHGVSRLFSDSLNTRAMAGAYTVAVTLKDEKGEVIASNSQDFDVFTPKDLKVPAAKVAVLERNQQVKSFLSKNDLMVEEFGPETDVSIPVIVNTPKHSVGSAFQQKVAAAKKFVEAGGTAIFLNVNGTDITWNNGEYRVPREMKDFDISGFPIEGKLLTTTGNYISRAHIATRHPIFAGLPVNMIMHGAYEEIHAAKSICRPSEGKLIAGVISYDQNKNMDIWTRHFKGVGDVWWAADVLEVEKGKGKMLFSTLKLVENLGSDPVADKILFNMITYAGFSEEDN